MKNTNNQTLWRTELGEMKPTILVWGQFQSLLDNEPPPKERCPIRTF